MPILRRGRPRISRPLVASATHIKIGDRNEAARLRRLRQGWQQEAWAYRDAIGEIRYPLEYMANATTRMRIYPALMVSLDQPPVPLEDVDPADAQIPDDLIAAAHADLNALGQGQIGLRPILHDLYVNTKVAGEMYLIGSVDDDDVETWEIRSIDEVTITEQGDVIVRDEPAGGSGSGAQAGTRLDPETSYVTRIWRPHPRFKALADSPMRAILDSSEELLLASRVIRALLRSRLAGNGVALLAQEVSLPGVNPTDDDPESDPVFEALAKAMLTPIQEEGDASSVVPLFLRVPADLVDKAFKHVTLDRPLDEVAMKLRPELIGRVANGMDWPRELVEGIADANHWSAWAVDESTFKGHIEPDVIAQCDELTAAYARPMLQARIDGGATWDPSLVKRLVYWYDPTELVTKPDQSANVSTAFQGGAAGRASLRKHLGLGDEDKPDQLDEVLYALQHLRGVDPAIAVPILQAVAPDIAWPDPSIVGPGAPQPGGAPQPSEPAPAVEPGPPPQPQAGEEPTPDDVTPPARAASGLAAILAAPAAPARTVHAQASRRLLDIDRQLRTRLLAACDAAIRRQLERAGARLRSKAAKSPTVRAAITDTANPMVAAALGPAGVADLGATDAELLNVDWTELRGLWDSWVSRAQRQARQAAAQILTMPEDDPVLADLEARQQTALELGWGSLVAGLTGLLAARLYDPHPDAPPLGEYDPNLTVPPALVREAIAIAGADPTALNLDDGQAGLDLPAGAFGIGGGQAITDFLEGNGAELESYQWLHGDTERPLDAHLALDGFEFQSWDDPGLVNNDSFPEVDVLAPGDHDGCSCDAWITWATGGTELPVAASSG